MDKKTPLVIRLKVAKEKLTLSIARVCQEEQLPYYLIEPIIAELHTQASALSAKEYEQAKRQVAEEEKKGVDPDLKEGR